MKLIMTLIMNNYKKNSSSSLSSKLGEVEFIMGWDFLGRLTERQWMKEVMSIEERIAEVVKHGDSSWMKKEGAHKGDEYMEEVVKARRAN